MQIRILTAVLVAASCAMLMADEAKSASQTRASQMRARRMARIAAEGGMVSRPVKGKAVRVAFKTENVKPEDFSNVFSEVARFLSINIEVVGAENATKNATGMVIAIIDSESQPTILVAPEDGWATLNIAKLKADKPSGELFRQRLHKEFWRTFGYALGAAHSQMQPCLMRTVSSVADLDRHKVAVLSPGPMGNVAASVTAAGFARAEYATYKKACEEGWAPAPTNDIQKAVWEKVHAMPTAPLKIKPETKKVKE